MALKSINKKIFTITFILYFLKVFGQQIEVKYNMFYVSDTISKIVNKKNMVLILNDNNSLFIDESFIKNNLNNKETPSDVNFMVKKENDILLKYYKINEDNFFVEETKPKINWKIFKESKIINGVLCQKATTFFRGRNWLAWFANDYPTQTGPYIFGGLPGIILEIEDLKKEYFFSMISISKKIDNILFPNKGIKINNQQLNKLYIDYFEDPYRKMKERGVVNFYDENGNQLPTPDFDKKKIEIQKYIKNNNNPIELDKAIKYP